MPPESALPDSDDIRLLTEIGFVAAGRGDVARAEAIFGALLALRPSQAAGHVGIAMALLNRGRAAEAAARLGAAMLPPGDEHDLLRAVQGLALQLDHRPAEAARVLQPIAAQPASAGAIPAGVRLARTLLGEAAEPTNAIDSEAARAGQTSASAISV